MTDFEWIYKITLFILMITFGIIKITLTKKHQLEDDEEGNNYPLRIKSILVVASIGLIFVPLFWIFSDLLSAGELSLPVPLRILGILLFGDMIALMYWQMKTLDVNISTIRQDRFLVTEGPYRYIRHPLYAVFIGIMLSTFLISSNWIVSIFIPIVIISMIMRIKFEEIILLNEYGENYKNYMNETSKLIPRVY